MHKQRPAEVVHLGRGRSIGLAAGDSASGSGVGLVWAGLDFGTWCSLGPGSQLGMRRSRAGRSNWVGCYCGSWCTLIRLSARGQQRGLACLLAQCSRDVGVFLSTGLPSGLR